MTSAPQSPSGRRDNGLASAEWGALVDLDPRLSEGMLDRLAAVGVAAYVEPALGAVDTISRAVALPKRPLDRLWVDPSRADQARTVVSAEVEDLTALLAEENPGATAHGLVQPVPRTAAAKVLPPPQLPPPSRQQPPGPAQPASDQHPPAGPPSRGPASGQNASDQPAAGQPRPDQPLPGQDASEQPAGGQPFSTQPAPGQPSSIQPAAGQALPGQDASDQPAASQPSSNQPEASQPRPDQVPPDQPAPDRPSPGAQQAPRAPAPGAPDPDEVWQQIVADWGRDSDDPVPPWPVSEDIDDAPPRRDPVERSSDPTRRLRRRTDPGSGDDALPAWLEPEALEDDGHFVPPPPPPVPKVRRHTVGSLTALTVGLILVFAPNLVGQVQSVGLGVVGIVLMLGGAGALVWYMRDAPPTDRGPDDGAVV